MPYIVTVHSKITTIRILFLSHSWAVTWRELSNAMDSTTRTAIKITTWLHSALLYKVTFINKSVWCCHSLTVSLKTDGLSDSVGYGLWHFAANSRQVRRVVHTRANRKHLRSVIKKNNKKRSIGLPHCIQISAITTALLWDKHTSQRLFFLWFTTCVLTHPVLNTASQ